MYEYNYLIRNRATLQVNHKWLTACNQHILRDVEAYLIDRYNPKYTLVRLTRTPSQTEDTDSCQICQEKGKDWTIYFLPRR